MRLMNNNKSFFESFQENLNESETKCYVLFFDKDGKHRAGSDYTIYSSYNTSNTKSKIMSGDIVHPVDAVSFIILDKSQYDAVTGSNWEKANDLYNKSTKLSTNESIIEPVVKDKKVDKSIPECKSVEKVVENKEEIKDKCDKEQISEQDQTVRVTTSLKDERDYAISDITELNKVADGDVQPPIDITGLLVEVDNRLSESDSNWGQINIQSTRTNTETNESNALFELCTKSGTYLMSMLLEENASVLKVNNTRGQTIFKRKSNNMSDLIESYIKQFIPMNESDKDDKIMQCIKSSQDRYDEYKLINAMISSYKELKDDERFMNVLTNKIYNLATIVCNEIHPSEPNEDNKLEMPTYDSIVEELFGKEFVRKENENKKEVSGTEQLTEDASSEPSEENTDKTDDNKGAENEVDKNHEVKQGLGTGYATFVRKPTNLDSLSDKAKYFTEGESSYIIVEQLKVSNQEFDDICNNFSKTYDFCKEMEPLDNENYSYNVIKIVTDNKDFSLLVDPSGYDYCRYVAKVGGNSNEN